jgi:hypothetical protein
VNWAPESAALVARKHQQLEGIPTPQNINEKFKAPDTLTVVLGRMCVAIFPRFFSMRAAEAIASACCSAFP